MPQHLNLAPEAPASASTPTPPTTPDLPCARHGVSCPLDSADGLLCRLGCKQYGPVTSTKDATSTTT